MPIERFTFQLRMESLGRLDASFSVGATQQWRITLLCCSTRTTLAHKPQHLLHCVRISERPENTDQQHNFSFIGLKSPQFSILLNSQFIKKGHKNFQLRRISVGWLSGIFPWNQWRLGSPLCHWWHKQLWRLTISTPRKSESFSTWRIEKGNFVCIDTRQYKLYQANKSKKMIVKMCFWRLRLPLVRGLRRFLVVFRKSNFSKNGRKNALETENSTEKIQ